MKKNESGRSMVEMLGVLAIIGVLSVGGIAGYTMAMNRYRANEVVDMANKYAVIVYSGWMTAKMMNNGTVPTGYTVPSFSKTGLYTGPDGNATSTVNGTTIEIDSETTKDEDNKTVITQGIGETSVTLKLTFNNKKICQAAATSLGISPSTCTSDESAVLTPVFKQS
ncbi:MAG: hypothetical protein IJO11_00200 [Alphaproteobacteria bacterium]|nr:hypothetical protein [Alphaproteobacteria bacterium]